MTCLDAIIVILARPTMPCIHLVFAKANIFIGTFLHLAIHMHACS